MSRFNQCAPFQPTRSIASRTHAQISAGTIEPDSSRRYYQICGFPDSAGKQGVRIVVWRNDALLFKERYIGSKKVARLVNTLPVHRFKTYSAAYLKDVPFPTRNDLATSQSSLLA
jgi:hypothetical protein